MADDYKSFNELVDRVEAKRRIYTAQDIAAAEARGFSAGEASMRERAAGVAAQHLPEKHRVNHTGDDYLDYVSVFKYSDGPEIAAEIRALKGAT